MMLVEDLTPGDRVWSGLTVAIFVSRMVPPMPLYADANLAVVAWWLPAESRVCLDLLSLRQDVGELAPGHHPRDRVPNLREALRGQARPL